MIRRAVVWPLALAMLATCAAAADGGEARRASRGDCASEDPRPWTPMAAPPVDADALRVQADGKPSFSVPQHWAAETWFSLGEAVMLCRSDAPLERACAGEWWQFGPSQPAGRPMTGRDSWVCLAT